MLLLFQRPVCAPLVRLRSTVSTLCLEGPSVYVFLCLYRLFEEEITGRRSTYSTYHNPLWRRSMQDACAAAAGHLICFRDHAHDARRSVSLWYCC